jgi:hypothetical protein
MKRQVLVGVVSVALGACAASGPPAGNAAAGCYRFETVDKGDDLYLGGGQGPAGLVLLGVGVAVLTVSAVADAVTSADAERCGLSDVEARKAAGEAAFNERSPIVATRSDGAKTVVTPVALRKDCGLFRVEDPSGVQYDELCRESGALRVVRAAIPGEQLQAVFDTYVESPAAPSARKRMNE